MLQCFHRRSWSWCEDWWRGPKVHTQKAFRRIDAHKVKNHQWACEEHEQRVLWLCWNLTCTNSGSYTWSKGVMWLLYFSVIRKTKTHQNNSAPAITYIFGKMLNMACFITNCSCNNLWDEHVHLNSNDFSWSRNHTWSTQKISGGVNNYAGASQKLLKKNHSADSPKTPNGPVYLSFQMGF